MSARTCAGLLVVGLFGTAACGTDRSAHAQGGEIVVEVDVALAGEEISPLITGVSGDLTVDEMHAAGMTLGSWGGNPATRYNYLLGNAWNNGSDWEFRNTNYGVTGDAMRTTLTDSRDGEIVARVAVPALGWVAKDDDNATCSFPDGSGGCLPAAAVGNCQEPQETADPELANVASTPELVATWIEALVADGLVPDIIAIDNEPELWGHTHYDVHPECTTYEEILDTYLTYTEALRAVAPDSLFAGPVICCWFDYWNNAPGPADGSGEDFLRWFLTNVKTHDDETGTRSIDVLDVHYYPQSEVYNSDVDPETSARRLRSPRALWDPDYVDESWIDAPIAFVPRMLGIVEETYPGLRLMISEWNFGADETMNGALAIADVLGIYGREGVYAAAYWRNPPAGSPGYLAFALHGNYDGSGSRFGGRTIPVLSEDLDRLSPYAALGDDGRLRVMLVNKDPEAAVDVSLSLAAFESTAPARRFTLSEDAPTAIVEDEVDPAATVSLAPSSITVIELEPA